MPKTRPIQIIKADEPWMLIHLSDGTTIKHRRIIMGVIQLLDDNGEPIINPDGTGQYAIQYQDVQIVEHSLMIEERQVDPNPNHARLIKKAN